MGVLSAKNLAVVRTSLSETVYGHLVEAIMSGELPSGAPLTVADLAEDLKVSPSPVRDALSRLAAEGLASTSANRRLTVVRFSRAEVEELFQVRELLECGAARLAAGRISPAQVAQLRSAAERCHSLHRDPAQKRATLGRDHDFHLMIAEMAGNSLLTQEIERLSRRVRVMQWLELPSAALEQAYPEHLEIIGALEKRDPDRAEVVVREHIRTAIRHQLDGLQSRPTVPPVH
jgi:DNA-binding GntR family transcriptional regulator